MVTEAEVHHACDTIDARGEEPKYEAIREILGGRGSWSTIKKYRSTWLAREDEVPPVPEAVHAHLKAIGAAVWRTAYPAAAATFAEQHRTHALEVTELAEALERAEAVIGEKAAASAGSARTIDELRARLAAAETAREDEARRYASLASEMAALATTTGQLQALLGGRSDPMPALRVVGQADVHEERRARSRRGDPLADQETSS